VSVINTRSFGRFWSVSWTITHCFGVSERFSLLRNAKVRLCVIHRHLPFWPILVRFMDYYSPFWAPGAISTINDPRGALTCRSSTLTFLTYSGPFHGLLLTVLGSRSDFHVCGTPSCAYVSFIHTSRFCRFWPDSWAITYRFGRFWPISLTITHRLGVPERFSWLLNPT